jgi:3-oxoadipate CoA-transferase alpha subunit
VGSVSEAVSGIKDGSSLLIGGFGEAGTPNKLVEAVSEKGVKGLTVISNNAGRDKAGLGMLILRGQVRKLICSYPTVPGSDRVKQLLEEGEVDLELVPQGTLVERIRAGGAGLGGILTPTGVGTYFSEGKITISVHGRDYLVESALTADFALIKCQRADHWGNLVYKGTARNFNQIMASAGSITIAQCERIEQEGIPPEVVHTPGIFVDRVIEMSEEPR